MRYQHQVFMRELLREVRQMHVGLARGVPGGQSTMRTCKCFTLPTCDLSKYPNKVTVHRDSLSHGMLPLVGRHSDISTNTMWLSFHKNTDEDLTSWLSILWEKVSCRQGFDMIGTYLPTTRSFFPISSFRIDDSRVGTAESAREDIGGDKHTLPESRYDIRNKARDSGIASYKKSTRHGLFVTSTSRYRSLAQLCCPMLPK